MITKIQLTRKMEKIQQEVHRIGHRLQGLKMLKKYYTHCLEGLERGYDLEVEHEVPLKIRLAKEKYTKKIENLAYKLEGGRQEELYLTHKLEALTRDIELCGIRPTSRDGKKKRV